MRCHEASHVFDSKNAPFGHMAWQGCTPHPAEIRTFAMSKFLINYLLNQF